MVKTTNFPPSVLQPLADTLQLFRSELQRRERFGDGAVIGSALRVVRDEIYEQEHFDDTEVE